MTTMLPAWARAETKPAPQPLLLVQAFVNTWDAENATDLLASQETGRLWLQAAGLAGPQNSTSQGDSSQHDPSQGDPTQNGTSQDGLSQGDLRRAREVRESLRALIGHNGGGPAPSQTELAPLTALAKTSRPRLSVAGDGRVALAAGPDGTLAGGLAGLLLIVRDAQQAGTWPRLKACRNPECRWAFYDRSHAHRGVWCDMATCGNMIKNRNFRARHG
jgi:predicted RNA-binding Zn ribbon-like protein